ncbi:hypothetical protein RJT34_14498 [Clitoria ternatea]|uniref:Uncharacterized protein n=1 Tax=Clitoria ternatea TaxID=43366 RepID=A0AAN9PMY1_CLITE
MCMGRMHCALVVIAADSNYDRCHNDSAAILDDGAVDDQAAATIDGNNSEPSSDEYELMCRYACKLLYGGGCDNDNDDYGDGGGSDNDRGGGSSGDDDGVGVVPTKERW